MEIDFSTVYHIDGIDDKFESLREKIEQRMCLSAKEQELPGLTRNHYCPLKPNYSVL